jgi:hypothetical protein
MNIKKNMVNNRNDVQDEKVYFQPGQLVTIR